MNLDSVLRERRSVRKYRKKPVEKEKLEELLGAIKYAPSAHNLQSYVIYVVEGKARKDGMARACLDQKFIASAPVVLVFCADSSRASANQGAERTGFYATLDATIATFTAVLKAHDLGLATCWIGAFSDDEVRKALSLPGNLAPIAIIPLGYPDEKPGMPRRRNDYVRRIG